MSDKGFVRNDNDKQQKQRFSLAASFRCALSGMAYIFRTQRNIVIHLCIALCAIVLGLLFALPPHSWIALILCIGAVLATEALNTAIESIVDLVSPEYQILAKRAKDCAAAGVLVSAIVSVIVGCIIFIPRVIALIF